MAKPPKPRTPAIEALGQRIKQLRIARGYESAERFAFEHGLSRTSYGKWEAGEDMRYTSIKRIADIHGLSMAEFFQP